ncbi:DUF4351 domain-containing protein [Chitinimonas arctica]|uniref:DUF4351 domain-containing protein n=1 Tax=Chitinimonas arctica TaxID=2594795 RepID=A0A516SLI1_9NEIS|nr:DUF4351 domain-containing protein [Chitinimonas arctica]QDQ28868.1 DUF4351 domain-containing protein [Chitinimonas arctica]
MKDWIAKLLLPSKFPQLNWPMAQLDEISDLQGVEAMMTNKMDLWAEEFIQKGVALGKAEGVEEGQANLLRRQILHKYGSLPEWVEERLGCATSEQLESWALQILSATSMDDVFSQH